MVLSVPLTHVLEMNKGISFEKKVARLYQKLGKKGVEHNVHLRQDTIHSQFDVSYGVRRRYFVECKYRSSGVVPFSEVATFAAKLYLHNIPSKQGIMVTNSSYDTRGEIYAKKKKIILIDGKKFSSLQSSPRVWWNKLF